MPFSDSLELAEGSTEVSSLWAGSRELGLHQCMEIQEESPSQCY